MNNNVMDSLDPELLKADECNKTVYEYMVTRYHRLMSQLKNSEEQLELASTENARFKFVTKRLERTVAELSSNDVNECPGNSGFDDDAFSLEECSTKLTNILYEYKRLFEETSKELDVVRETLAKSEEHEKCLKKYVDHVEASGANDRVKRNRMEAEWRSLVDRLSVDLDEARLVQNRTRETQSDRLVEAKLAKRLAAQDADRLRADIGRLTADLSASRAAEDLLHARVAELESALFTHVALFSQDAVVTDSRDSFSSVNQQNQSRNEGPESWDRAETEDAMELGSPLRLGRGDDVQRSADYRKSTSTSADHATYGRESSSGSAANSTAAASDETDRRKQPEVPTMPVPYWYNAELVRKYESKNKVPAADGDDCRGTPEPVPSPTLPDWHTIELIRKYETKSVTDDDDDRRPPQSTDGQTSSTVSAVDLTYDRMSNSVSMDDATYDTKSSSCATSDAVCNRKSSSRSTSDAVCDRKLSSRGTSDADCDRKSTTDDRQSSSWSTDASDTTDERNRPVCSKPGPDWFDVNKISKYVSTLKYQSKKEPTTEDDADDDC